MCILLLSRLPNLFFLFKKINHTGSPKFAIYLRICAMNTGFTKVVSMFKTIICAFDLRVMLTIWHISLFAPYSSDFCSTEGNHARLQPCRSFSLLGTFLAHFAQHKPRWHENLTALSVHNMDWMEESQNRKIVCLPPNWIKYFSENTWVSLRHLLSTCKQYLLVLPC